MDPSRLAEVAEELEALCAPGAELHRDSVFATYGGAASSVAPERVRYQRRLLDDLLEAHEGGAVGGDTAGAVITAGPPGAGKSTALRNMGLIRAGALVVDADRIKARLLEAAVSDGIFNELLARRLADGYPIMALELSSLVHNESVLLADRLIERSMEAGTTVVIEGTFSWDGLGQRYLRMLDEYGYSSVLVLDVEVDREMALRQAYTRWSDGRAEAIKGKNHLGGRFMPRDAIECLYDAQGRFSRCNRNVVDFFNDPRAECIDDFNLIVRSGTDTVPSEFQRVMGEYVTARPGHLG